MDKKVLCATLSALALLCGIVGTASALVAPTSPTCTNSGEGLSLDWGDVDGADKYSVDFRCEMGEGDATVTVEFDIGTGDREDDGEKGDSDLEVSNEQLNDAALIEDLTGYQCFAKVKALNPGKGKGKQNHTFSDLVDCGTIGTADSPE